MPEHFRQPYNPPERTIILSYLSHFDRTAGGKILGQGLMEIYDTFDRLNLQEIEKMLRQIGSKTFLISLSMRHMPQYEAKLPGTIRPLPYFLWAEVNGKQEALKTLREAGIDYDKNFERLPETGLLVPREESLISQALKTTLN